MTASPQVQPTGSANGNQNNQPMGWAISGGAQGVLTWILNEIRATLMKLLSLEAEVAMNQIQLLGGDGKSNKGLIISEADATISEGQDEANATQLQGIGQIVGGGIGIAGAGFMTFKGLKLGKSLNKSQLKLDKLNKIDEVRRNKASGNVEITDNKSFKNFKQETLLTSKDYSTDVKFKPGSNNKNGLKFWKNNPKDNLEIEGDWQNAIDAEANSPEFVQELHNQIQLARDEVSNNRNDYHSTSNNVTLITQPLSSATQGGLTIGAAQYQTDKGFQNAFGKLMQFAVEIGKQIISSANSAGSQALSEILSAIQGLTSSQMSVAQSPV